MSGCSPDIVNADTAARRVQIRALAGFAAISFLLAGVGIHGLLAFAVSSRTREIGLRMALGARSSELIAMVMRRGAFLAALGVSWVSCSPLRSVERSKPSWRASAPRIPLTSSERYRSSC